MEITVKRRRLHAGQLRLKASTARFRVAMFGRRWGKNVEAIDEAMDDALAGKYVGWFEPTYKYFVEAWRDLVARLAPVTKKKDDGEKRLELITGGVIEGWTCDTPDPGRSRRYHKVIINEAGIIRNLLAIWQESIRPTLTDFAGGALFLGTPKGRTHDFSVLHAKAATTEGWQDFRGPTSENPHIPREEIDAARRELPPKVFAQEYEGVPADDGGNPFGLDAIALCVMTQPEWVGLQERGKPIAWGWDFARAQDWTVGIALDGKYRVCRFDRWQLKPWEETYRLIVKDTADVYAVGDSTGIGDVVVETLQRRGVGMEGYQFSQPSKQRLMERLASCIQQQKLKIPPNSPIRAELETFGYEYTRGGVRYCAPEGMSDDCVMALALAVYGRDQFGEVPLPALKSGKGDDDTHPGVDWKHGTRLPKHAEPTRRKSYFPGAGRKVRVS